MAGHSKWEQIKRQKSVNDAKRGAHFTKLGNTIAIAARSGDDPDMNFSLRLAIEKAKAANMPMNNIQRAIDRGSGKLGGDQIQEVMYEGYGPGGAAILVECATDNVNRTFPMVKLAFSKHGGSIGEKGSVAYQFDQKGVIRIKGSGEDVLLQVLDAGAEDAAEEDDEIVVYTDAKELAKVRDTLKDQGLEVTEAGLAFIPNMTVEINDEKTEGKLVRLLEALDDLDDVVETYTNFELSI